ncbi:uncharacterized protein LOC135222421 [Macrobrachium nipponense]|uniref:uncharacterized protein LOC135222421 n=1 Tax=Macrobrachium nipponense TaxID=159736 RepID=UPI0030C820A0
MLTTGRVEHRPEAVPISSTPLPEDNMKIQARERERLSGHRSHDFAINLILLSLFFPSFSPPSHSPPALVPVTSYPRSILFQMDGEAHRYKRSGTLIRSPFFYWAHVYNGKPLTLNVNGGQVFKTSARHRPRPATHAYTTNNKFAPATTVSSNSSGSSGGHRSSLHHHPGAPQVPSHHDHLQMTPLTVPLLPHVAPRPILTQRTPPPSRSARVYSGRRTPPGRPYAQGNNHGHFAAQIQLLRPNNTPVSVEKVDLDRRGLTSWPVLGAGDEPVRLLSLQHNLLTRVDPPAPSPTLVLLDLYHNHLHNLQGLHAFQNLRVLMLAKNRLSRLDGLENLSKLEVLDLHGNQLHHVQGLAHLKAM